MGYFDPSISPSDTSGADPVNPQDMVNLRTLNNRSRVTGTLIATSVPTTVETAVQRLLIPSNTFKVGSLIDLRIVYKPAVAAVITTRLRIGTTGTTSDAAVASVGTGTSSANAQMLDALGVITAIGPSASFLGTGVNSTGTSSNTPTAAPAASGTFDSTVDNYITVTLVNGTSTTTTVYLSRMEVNI